MTERGVLASDEDTITLACDAARRALDMSGLPPEEIGALYLGTETSPYVGKASASCLVDMLGVGPDIMCGDCQFSGKSGTMALQIVMAMVEADIIKYGIAIGADTLSRHFDPGNPLFEFVNIREQCAWIYEDNPTAATETASAMVAAAVAKTRLSVIRPRALLPLEKTVLIIGNGPAATISQGALSAQRIQALRLRTTPHQIRQTPNHFTVVHGASRLWKGSALILAPRDTAEQAEIHERLRQVTR